MFELIGTFLVSIATVPLTIFFIMSFFGWGLKSRFYRLCFNISIGWDQLLNAYLLGYADETISSRAGKGRRAGKWYWTLIADTLDLFDANHAEDAIEDDEGRPTPRQRLKKISTAKRVALRKSKEA